MIDTNAYLSHWPFRRVPLDAPGRLLARMDRLQIRQAWVSSFDALLHRDVAAVNQRLLATVQASGGQRFIAFGCVNPALPDWQEDVRRCAVEFQMPGIRLHPGYHGYELDDPQVHELLELATGHGMVVQIALKMEDERTQHPLVQVPFTDPTPLIPALIRIPEARVMLLNGLKDLRGSVLARLVHETDVVFDLAMLEGIGGVSGVLKSLPAERLLFGTFAPLFAPESAVGKLTESDLGATLRERLANGNARELLRIRR